MFEGFLSRVGEHLMDGMVLVVWWRRRRTWLCCGWNMNNASLTNKKCFLTEFLVVPITQKIPPNTPVGDTCVHTEVATPPVG